MDDIVDINTLFGPLPSANSLTFHFRDTEANSPFLFRRN